MRNNCGITDFASTSLLESISNQLKGEDGLVLVILDGSNNYEVIRDEKIITKYFEHPQCDDRLLFFYKDGLFVSNTTSPRNLKMFSTSNGNYQYHW